jgi:uncharacterized protein
MEPPDGNALAGRIRQAKPIRRILSLDGGGVRGVFAIEILFRMEELIRTTSGNKEALLSDYFDLIAGTSTGAIIATCISWGMPVSTIRAFYHERAKEIFSRAEWYRQYQHKFHAVNITELLKETFVEEPGREALLGTEKLKTVLLMAMQNFTTGSAWPVTNNPFAKYNDLSHPESNLRIPLWKLVRASTAAPTFFEPQSIEMGDKNFVFVDGALTPYNNPALIAYLTATLPKYNISWPEGENRLLVISLGNGRSGTGDAQFVPKDMNMVYAARQVPKALMDGMSVQQDTMCRVLGKCLHGEVLDSEIGDLIESAEVEKRFSYARYNQTFTEEEIEQIKQETGCGLELDNLDLLEVLTKHGASYAADNVKPEHLLL